MPKLTFRQSGQGRSTDAISRRPSLLWALAACALLVGTGRVVADAEAVKSKAETCAAGHGDNGISRTENVPSLAGEPDQFLQWQLVCFRSGARKNEVMEPVA
jgi:cytochrome c553